MSNKKTLSFLKKEIQSRYKGRGNTWVKVEFKDEAFLMIDKLLKEKNCDDVNDYRKHISREGYAWMRFIKTEGKTPDQILSVFEVRVRGSKEDHPEFRINFTDNTVKDLKLLGNTPLKLQLESDNKKLNISLSKKMKSLEEVKKEEIHTWESRLEKVEETSLTEPSIKELKEWTNFLKASGLLKD
jgi:hypothetical protein